MTLTFISLPETYFLTLSVLLFVTLLIRHSATAAAQQVTVPVPVKTRRHL